MVRSVSAAALAALVGCAASPSSSSSSPSSSSDPTTAVAPAPPSPPTIAIDPPVPASSIDLRCAIVDPNPAWTYAITWTRNGSPWLGSLVDGERPGDTVPAVATGQGDRWACAAVALAGEVASAEARQEVQIGLWGDDRTFTPCGLVGRYGPDQASCDAAYAGGPLHGAVTVDTGFQSWIVPATGWYWITAAGAQGAGAVANFGEGGRGASASGRYLLDAGAEVRIAVGQAGVGRAQLGAAGGGGGSFVSLGDADPIVVAGGGGGSSFLADPGCPGLDGPLASVGSGYATSSECLRWADGEGQGGHVSAAATGAGGGGLDTAGQDDAYYGRLFGRGGASWRDGLLGGTAVPQEPDQGCGALMDGGFGGGGSGNGCDPYGAGGGGGGGYSGGGGGLVAGGGASFVSAPEQTLEAGVQEGDGAVRIILDE